ncbi:hypothetical protein D3C78_1124320 [compost metagenome]
MGDQPAGQRTFFSVTLVLGLDPRLSYPVDHGRTGLLPDAVGNQLPPDHYGQHLGTAGENGQRGRLGVCDVLLAAVVLRGAWLDGAGRAGQRHHDAIRVGKRRALQQVWFSRSRRCRRQRVPYVGETFRRLLYLSGRDRVYAGADYRHLYRLAP